MVLTVKLKNGSVERFHNVNDVAFRDGVLLGYRPGNGEIYQLAIGVSEFIYWELR